MTIVFLPVRVLLVHKRLTKLLALGSWNQIQIEIDCSTFENRKKKIVLYLYQSKEKREDTYWESADGEHGGERRCTRDGFLEAERKSRRREAVCRGGRDGFLGSERGEQRLLP
jgi:hypothetical protein